MSSSPAARLHPHLAELLRQLQRGGTVPRQHRDDVATVLEQAVEAYAGRAAKAAAVRQAFSEDLRAAIRQAAGGLARRDDPLSVRAQAVRGLMSGRGAEYYGLRRVPSLEVIADELGKMDRKPVTEPKPAPPRVNPVAKSHPWRGVGYFSSVAPST